MKTTKRFQLALLLTLGWCLGLVQHVNAQGEQQLPPGWTAEDMAAMVAAATPGEEHGLLMKEVGDWTSETTMWMTPDSEAVESTGTATVKPILDGRFTQVEWKGEIPGMGPYNGIGTYGFDNVKKKYVSTWMDNMATGMMVGEGELTEDGKKLTWEYKGQCPIQKKEIVMREVETITSPTTKTLEFFGPDPKTGKDYKHMEIKLTKK
jgi:hypothetical protein